MAYLEFFSQARLDLQQEVANDAHAELWPYIAKHRASDFELRLLEIATYCEVIVDGYYSNGEIDKLCEILTKKLREKRTGIIIVQSLDGG